MPRIFGALAFSLVALAAGCADNPVTPEEHFEARGVVIEQTAGAVDSTVATVDGNAITGALRVDSAAARSFTVRFILENGTIAQPAGDPDAGWLNDIAITVADTTIARVRDVRRWGFRLEGIAPGTTTLTVHLLHGGHDDYVSAPVPVVVEP